MALWVQKARRGGAGSGPRKPLGPDVVVGDAKLKSLADAMESSTRASLTKGLSTLRTNIDAGDVLKALRDKDVSAIMRHVGPAMRDPVAQAIRDAHEDMATHGVAAMPKRIAARLEYSPNNPNVKKYIRESAGQLITTSERGLKTAVRAMTTKAIGGSLSMEQAAETIRASIGLNEQQSSALAAYRAGLAESGRSRADISAMVSDRADEMLDQRAMMIARTEIRNAQNQAQNDIWNEASDQGLIPQSSQKVWVVDGNPCAEWCIHMDGKAVGIDDLWYVTGRTSGRTQAVYTPSEIHPHCMCTMSLRMGKEDD